MRRTFASTLLAMCCLLVGARVCTVRPGGTSITEALAITMECDTIRVLKGTYREGALTVQRLSLIHI